MTALSAARSELGWSVHDSIERALTRGRDVKQALADLGARETIKEGERFAFHGLRKNACYLLKMGMNDSEVGSKLGMSPDVVRHYGKRSRALMIARGAADQIAGGTVAIMPGARASGKEK